MTPAAPLSPLEDDDLLHEILLRLPPQPCSLPRASAVCRRWLGLVTDRKFTARFRAHHRKPPLLGVFHRSDSQGIAFTPLLDPPHRIPTLRIDLRRRYKDYNVLSCRHGRVLAMNPRHTKLLVCDPITGKRCRVAVPRVFRQFRQSRGSLLCDDRAQYHVHGGCHSGHFKVVLMTEHTLGFIPIACIYSSKTKTWGKIMSTAAPSEHRYYGYDFPGVLIGNALYWLLSVGMGRDMLVLDLYEQSLAVIAWPLITSEFQSGYRRIVEAEDGAVGLAILSYPRFRIWQRNANLHGVATWEIWKTIDMNNIPGIPRNVANYVLLGYCEDTDAFFISLERNVYMVQLKSMQSRRIHGTQHTNCYHPFASFYAPEVNERLLQYSSNLSRRIISYLKELLECRPWPA